MRVLLDTNVLARATPGRNSPARQLLDALLLEPHALIASKFLLNELGRVLRYERVRRIHGLDEVAIEGFVQAIREACLIVDSPQAGTLVSADPDDNPILATAIEAQVDVICTWDRHFHAHAVQQHLATVGIRVLRDTELLVELSPPVGPVDTTS